MMTSNSPFVISIIVKITQRETIDLMLDLKEYARKGLKFMVIGAVGSVVNLGVLYALVEYFKLWYLWAEVIAILVAFMVNYNGNILVKNIHVGNSSKDLVPPRSTSPDVIAAEKTEDIPARAAAD